MDEARAAVLLTVAYDGRGFAGYALQRDHRSVAGELLRAIQTVDPSVTAVRGASRTDTGVHARGQRVAFDPQRRLAPRGWVLALAQRLPTDVAVKRGALVPAGFTPRFCCSGKHYRYTVLREPVRDPFWEGRAWRVSELARPGALERMNEEGLAALGTHDFRAFRSAADDRTNTVRTMRRLTASACEGEQRLVHIDVEGDAFLHNMVRILVGTLVEVGRGRRAPGAIARALASGQRTDAGITAPANGLCLEAVQLHDEGTEAWPPLDTSSTEP